MAEPATNPVSLLHRDHGPAPDLPGHRDRLRAIPMAAALGDALAHGSSAPAGVSSSSAEEAQDGALRITADTQLMLYALDGLLEAVEWAGKGEGADETACQWLAQLRWLRTQDVAWPAAAPSPLPRWIDECPVLQADRGHQGQTLEALRTGAMGEVERPVLPAADDRTAMIRAIPFGLLPVGWRSMAALGINAAAITHGDAEAQSASVGTALVLQAALVAGCRRSGAEAGIAPEDAAAALEDAAEAAWETLAELTRPSERTRELLRTALTASSPSGLGDGASAPQSLAIAVWAALGALREAGSPTAALELAVRRAAEAAAEAPRSPAPLAAALVAAVHGTAALPTEALAELEARDVLEEAAQRWIDGLGISA